MITLSDIQLADIIAKEPNPDGRVFWLPSDLPAIKIALRALQVTAQTPDGFLIDSVMPYWLYLCIMSALAPKTVSLSTPNFGPAVIPQNTPEGAGKGLAFRVHEEPEFTLVQFSCPRYLQASELSTIVPPAVNPAKGVIISSNAPPWIIATVGLAYAGSASWVACTQKHAGPIVCVSKDKAVAIGSEIDKGKVQEAHARAAKGAVPKRGEIWIFDAGYGDHPGIVISPTARNEHSFDVLVIPLTTSAKRAHRHLLVSKASTRLAEDSYAQCSNISKLDKEQLLKGPIGVVSDDLMHELVQAVRQAIGDIAA